MKLGKFIAGLGVGLIAGILVAPKKGSETVEDIKDTSKKVYEKSKNLSKEDVIQAINSTTDKIKVAIEEFDVEKAKESTKEKVDEVKDGIDNLVTKAKENESCQEIFERIEVLSKKAMDKINEYKNKMTEYGQDLYDEFQDEMYDEFEDVKEEIDDLFDEIIETKEDKDLDNNG